MEPWQQMVRSMTTSPLATQSWRVMLALLTLGVGYLALSPLPPPSANLGWDKLNHASAFAALALAGWLSVHGPRGRWLMMAAALAFGGLIEVAQLFVPGRSSEWADLLADAVGIGFGALFAAGLLAMAGASLSRRVESPCSRRND